jgi:hypothetical protein
MHSRSSNNSLQIEISISPALGGTNIKFELKNHFLGMSTFNAQQLPVASLILNLTFLTHFEYSSLRYTSQLISQEGQIFGQKRLLLLGGQRPFKRLCSICLGQAGCHALHC